MLGCPQDGHLFLNLQLFLSHTFLFKGQGKIKTTVKFRVDTLFFLEKVDYQRKATNHLLQAAILARSVVEIFLALIFAW